jgi:hypothetical protein
MDKRQKGKLLSDITCAHSWGALKAKTIWLNSKFVKNYPSEEQRKTRYRNPVYRAAYVVNHDRALIKLQANHVV